ncbi:MAG: hypothetical protein JO128_12550, partial [Alphaproteobacteria bacterium]|nr:hypothetical protein [Alphaproteobacteria bacterium]
MQRLRRGRLTRREFLPGAAGVAGGLALWPLFRPAFSEPAEAQIIAGGADHAIWPSNNKIKHVVILCQENRSFDHYFGAFASMFGRRGDTALGFTPSQLTYKDSAGDVFHPYHLTQFCNGDPDHSWEGSHAKWNGGAMDGWVKAEDGQTTAIGYFLAS